MSRKLPLYQTVYEDFLSRIGQNELNNNDRIPTETELSLRYKVSRITIRKALDMLSRKGILRRAPGQGTFITEDGAEKALLLREQKTTRCIGFITPGIQDSFGQKLLNSLEQLAFANGYTLLIGISNQNPEKESALLKTFRDHQADGLIILPVDKESFSSEILELMVDHFPTVMVDRYLREIGHCSNVVSDNRTAGFTAADTLFENNHRNIAVFSRELDSSSTLTERYMGVMDACARRGIPVNKDNWLTSFEGADSFSRTLSVRNIEYTKEFFSRRRDITAVITMEYLFTLYLLTALDEMGLSVPGDVSLVGIDGPGFAEERIPKITHLAQDEDRIARESFSLLMNAVNGEPDAQKILVPCTFVKGRSVRCL